MKKLYSLATAALLAVSSFNASAQIDVNVSIDPAETTTFEVFPDSFTLTFDGTVDGFKIENLKGAVAATVVKVTTPENKTQSISGTGIITYEGNKAIVKTNKASGDPFFTKDIKGEYTITVNKASVLFLDADKQNLKFDGKNSSLPGNVVFKYNVTGKEEQGGGEEDDSVKYDIELTSTVPQLLKGEFDASMRTLETLQLNFKSASALQVKEGAQVTIAGPSYSFSAAIVKGMGNTNFKANFPTDPIYNGEYTLTIPEGVIGDEAYMADNTKGHANAAVNVKFTLIEGQDMEEGKIETVFNPVVNPAMGKTEKLDNVTLTFPSEVFYDANKEFKVGIKTDFSALSYTNYGVATLERVSDSVLKLVFNPAPAEKGEYQVVVPEGSFWDAEHNADDTKGKINAEQSLVWNYSPKGVAIKVLSTEPAKDARLGEIASGFKFIVNTDNNEAVGSLKITIEELNPDSDSAMPRNIVNGATSTAKTEKGAPCWINEGSTLTLKDGYLYTAFISVYDTNGIESTSVEVEFYGDSSVGVMQVELDGENVVIYNMNGVRVKDAANLPAGLYIRNGKKVVIK